MKDYFNELKVTLKKKGMNIIWENIKMQDNDCPDNVYGYPMSDEVLLIYNYYILFELNWITQDKKYRGFVKFVPYNNLEGEHQNLIEIMESCYDKKEDYLKIREDIENWYPLFKFPNEDMFCLDVRNGKIVFYEHEVYDSGVNLHGLTIALSINDLFEKWSKCYFVDIYDWYIGTNKDGIDLKSNIFTDLKKY